MILYSQKDPRWKNKRIGTCTDTFGQSGCNITAMAMLSGKTPEEVNASVPFTNGCLMYDKSACAALGLEFLGRQSTPPSFTCKAETDHYKNKGVPQHFFIWRPDGMIADPLDYPCVWKKNPYNIVSFRLIKPITNESMSLKMPGKLKDEIKKYGLDLGDNLDEKDLMPLKEAMSTMRNERDDIKDEAFVLIESNEAKEKHILELEGQIAALSARPESCPECDSTAPVPVQTIEVKVPIGDFSALELLKMAVKKWLG